MVKSTVISKYSGKNQQTRDRRITFGLFVTPAVVLYSIFFIFPVILGIYYSLTDWNGIAKNYQFIGLDNYISILKDSDFINACFFNLKYVVVLIILVPSISLCLAILLNSKIRFKTAFRTLYFFPAVLSMLTVGLIFNEILNQVLPAVGNALNIGILKSNLLASPNTAMFGILMTHIWQGVAVPTVLFIAGLQAIPQDLVEAAEIDGANAWQRFKTITLPFILPILSIVLVLVLKDGLSVFDYICALTAGGPAGSTTSMALIVYNYGFTQMKFSYGISGAMIMSLIIMIISFIQIRYTNKKRVY